MRAHFKAGKVVILNVNNGGHWVLTTGLSGTNFLVNDAGVNKGSYTQGQVVGAGILRKRAAMTEEEIIAYLENPNILDIDELSEFDDIQEPIFLE